MFTLIPVTYTSKKFEPERSDPNDPNYPWIIEDYRVKMMDLKFIGGITLRFHIPISYDIALTSEPDYISINYVIERRLSSLSRDTYEYHHKCDIECKDNVLYVSMETDVPIYSMTEILTDNEVDSLRHCVDELQKMVDERKREYDLLRLESLNSRDSDSSDDIGGILIRECSSSDSDQ